MEVVTPREALRYALSREMAMLYAVVLAGWLAVTLGAGFYAGFAFRGPVQRLVSFVVGGGLILVGIVALYGGGIALVYKVIADANTRARR